MNYIVSIIGLIIGISCYFIFIVGDAVGCFAAILYSLLGVFAVFLNDKMNKGGL